MALRVELLLEVLPIMVYGMVGVFGVTGGIIGVVAVLNRWVSKQ